MQTLSKTGLGGEVFLVSDLQDFPTEACTFSLWTHQPTRLFYGQYDTGSIFDDTVTFLDISVQSGGMELTFAGTSHYFSGGALPLFWTEEAHHLAITLQSTPTGYTISCYANAVLIDTVTLDIVNGNNQPMRLLPSGPLYIGNRAPDRSQDGGFGDLQEARGCMSELHVYREALSAEAVNFDALGEVPENVTPYLNLPLDDIHHDRRRGLWLDTIQPFYHAQERIRTDNNPTIMFTRNYSRFPTGDRSVAFWVRCTEGASGTLISYGDVSNSDHPNDGGSTWILEDPSGLSLNGYGSGLQVGTGTWNHVAIVEDTTANTTIFYLNGQPGPNPPVNTVIDGVITDQPLLIGAKQATDANDTVFTGDLVDLRFWSRPLSAAEVAEFARGVVPDSSDPALTDYQPLGAFDVGEDMIGNNRMFLPMLTDEVKYPLQSTQAMKEVLHVGPDKGGMHTLAYTNLTGTDFSLELWAQTTTDGFLLLGLGPNNTVSISLARQGNQLILLIKNASDDHYTQFMFDASGKELNEWHHLAVTIASTGVSGYLDGEESFTTPLANPGSLMQLGDQLQFQFGAFAGRATPVEGSFAEIRFWNRALAVGEIRHGMYHYLAGNELGLVGLWAFENALGRDSSPSKRHAFPVDKPEFTELSDIDLEPLGSPYLVAQVTLMEDYHFDDDQITTRNSYRVLVTAYDGNDRPLPQLDLSISIQAEPNNPFQNANVLTEDTGKTTTYPIAINQPYVMATNSQGIIGFALEAEDLLAPVLRITAPFMLKDHALLIFPDRQAHHQLAQVTGEDLLNKKVQMAPNEAPRAMVSAEHQDSAPHIAKAIQNFMGVATEKTPQSNTPVVRPVEDRLREIVTPPTRRLYENATASPHAYSTSTDVISGYAVVEGQSSISRSLSVNQLPDWSFGKNEAGTYVVPETHPSSRTRNLALTENLIVDDPLTRLLLGLTNKRQRSETPISYADLLAAIDETNRTRGIFDLFAAIRDAVSFVVQTVEHVYDTIKETIRVAVIYIKDISDAVTAFAIHTVQHAVEAVKGVLYKVGATVLGAINFVKALLDWDDILETQRFNEQLLMSVMASTRANLGTTKTDTIAWAKNLRGTVHDWLESLKTNATAHKSAIKDDAVPAERTNVKGSYMQHMVGTHVKDATLDGDTAVGTPDNQSQEALDKIHNDNTDKVDQINGALANLHLFSGTDFSLSAIVDRLIDLLEAVAEKVFDVMIAGIEWFFQQLEKMLKELDKLLAYRIDIPLVTRLYEQVIMKQNDPNSHPQLTLYSLGALLGAIPATIIYKLATGSDHGPFHGEELARYRDVITSILPVNQDQRTQLQIEQEKASLGLGGCFLGLIAVTGIFNTFLNATPDAPAKLKRVGLVFNSMFQLSQFPLGSSFKLQTNPNDAPAAIEEAIWAIQFFPLVLEGITASDKLTANKAFVKFSSVATTLFGGLHVALFITVFALEMAKSETDKEDSAVKFVSNLSSCVPELTAMVPQPIAKALLSAVASSAWELLSLVRYANEVKAHHNFSPR